MIRKLYGHQSKYLKREMNILVHGEQGIPLIAFPCQDGMCDNWESFQMQDTLSEYILNGKIQLFSVDTVDKESWSDTYGDKEHRAEMQDRYYHYIVEEALPYIKEINGSDTMPFLTGFSLGATHAAIVFLRRPDLFAGVLACSGCYDATEFWDGWCNPTLYDNSPVSFLTNMWNDHPYIDLYNQRKIAIVVGQGRWEEECRRTTGLMKEIFERKGINGRVDFWGTDVDHDWPWWRKQILYFLPWLLGEREE